MGPNNGVMYDPYTGQYVYPNQQPRQSFQSFANNQQKSQNGIPRLNCRFIDDPTKIMPSEVPTNGQPACFIMEDYSSVYLKAINSNGTIDTVQYAPVRQEKPEDIQRKQFEDFRFMVDQRFANLEALISSMKQSQRSNDKRPQNNEGGNRNA